MVKHPSTRLLHLQCYMVNWGHKRSHTVIKKSRASSSWCCGLALSHGLEQSHRFNIIEPWPLGQNCPRKIAIRMIVNE